MANLHKADPSVLLRLPAPLTRDGDYPVTGAEDILTALLVPGTTDNDLESILQYLWNRVTDPAACSAWDPNASYAAGDLVVYDDSIWITTTDLDATPDPPSTEGASWVKLSAPSPLEIQTSLILPDVDEAGNLEAVLDHIWEQLTDLETWRGAWDTDSEYLAGQLVSHNSAVWLTTTDLGDTADAPGTEASWLKLSVPSPADITTAITLPGASAAADLAALLAHLFDRAHYRGAYDASLLSSYRAGDVVSAYGAFYRVRNTPPSVGILGSANWPDEWIQETTFPSFPIPWSVGIYFATGTAVRHNNRIYLSRSNTSHVEPGVADGWEAQWTLVFNGDSADDLTGPEVVTLLEALTGDARLNASAIRNLPSSSGGLSAEEVRDTVGAFVRGRGDISVAHNDALDILWIEYYEPTIAEIITGIEGKTGEGRLDYNALKNLPDVRRYRGAWVQQNSYAQGQIVTHDGDFWLIDQDIPGGRGAPGSYASWLRLRLSADEIVSLLEGLTGDDRLDYSALKGAPSIPSVPTLRTGAETADLLEGLSGNDRLNYSALRNTPTIPSSVTLRTASETADLLETLSGDDRLDYGALKNRPTIPRDLDRGTWSATATYQRTDIVWYKNHHWIYLGSLARVTSAPDTDPLWIAIDRDRGIWSATGHYFFGDLVYYDSAPWIVLALVLAPSTTPPSLANPNFQRLSRLQVQPGAPLRLEPSSVDSEGITALDSGSAAEIKILGSMNPILTVPASGRVLITSWCTALSGSVMVPARVLRLATEASRTARLLARADGSGGVAFFTDSDNHLWIRQDGLGSDARIRIVYEHIDDGTFGQSSGSWGLLE